jgi:hypothetical protein
MNRKQWAQGDFNTAEDAKRPLELREFGRWSFILDAIFIA